MSSEVRFEAPSWNRIYRMLYLQSLDIRASKFAPDVIVGVSRGGWIPARILSDLLDNKNLANAKIESYAGIDKKNEETSLTQALSTDVESRKVLVVDEVADSGRSLNLITKHTLQKGAKEVKTATLFRKSYCAFKPDFFEAETYYWIVFPWEIRETISNILLEHKSIGAETCKEISELQKAGVPKHIIPNTIKDITRGKTC